MTNMCFVFIYATIMYKVHTRIQHYTANYWRIKKQHGWHTMNTEKETSQSQTLTKDTLAYVKQGFIVEVI